MLDSYKRYSVFTVEYLIGLLDYRPWDYEIKLKEGA
jgi:hypothetical protein